LLTGTVIVDGLAVSAINPKYNKSLLVSGVVGAVPYVATVLVAGLYTTYQGAEPATAKVSEDVLWSTTNPDCVTPENAGTVNDVPTGVYETFGTETVFDADARVIPEK
jgi:tetrahydromethanopterin S-methyltransferase subunit D